MKSLTDHAMKKNFSIIFVNFWKKAIVSDNCVATEEEKKRGERVNAVHQVHSFLKFEKNKKNSLLQSCSRQEKEGIIEKRTQKKE